MTETIGHNSIGVSEGDFHALLARHSKLDMEAEIINAKRKKLRKEIQSAGIKLTEFDDARKIVALSRDEQSDKLAHLAAYLSWLRSPVAPQLTFDFGSGEKEETEAEIESRVVSEAGANGWRAGITGSMFEVDCPYAKNEPAGQEWIKQYRLGQRQAAKALAAADETKSTNAGNGEDTGG